MAIKIEYLDGPRLYKAISDGIVNLAYHQQTLDEINVFPVPDGADNTTSFPVFIRYFAPAPLFFLIHLSYLKPYD